MDEFNRPLPPSASAERERRARLVRGLATVILIAFAVTAGVLWAAYAKLSPGLPALAKLEEQASTVGGTLVLGARGDTLASYYYERRVNVSLDEVPDHLERAVLSVEDWRFYRHWGLDLTGLARAAVHNIRGRGRQGASTLTQQLARNLFLSHEQTVSRKLREALLALRIERKYTKDEILRMYLNQIYFGEGAYGIEAAARTYFDKPAKELDLLEAATLAGLPKNPNGYSPLDHPDRARKRRNVVLSTMLAHHLITKAQFDSLVALPLITHPGSAGEQTGGYFTEEVRKYLEEHYGSTELYRGELRVYTTLDTELQRGAERALEKRFTEVEDQMSLSPSRRDYLAAKSRGQDPEPKYLQGALVVMNPHNGRILAMIGGRSFAESRFNRALQAKRQPGSCFKPFVYATALQHGVGPSEILLDTPLVIEMPGNQEPWKPQNYTMTFSGPVSVRLALAKSLNIPAIKLLQRVGAPAVIATAKKMGIETKLEPVLSLALGTSEVTLLELTRAYGVLANNGISSRPYFIERIEDRRGKVLERATEYHEESLDPQTAYVVTSMLESALDWGTGHNARDLYGIKIPAAGKTGTTDDLGDGWFVGYTPDLVIGVWGGFDERRPIGLAGSYIALPPWCDVLRQYTATHPTRDFTEPSGITALKICVDSGKLSTPQCPRVQMEIFTTRTVPKSECDLHSLAGAMERAADVGLGAMDDPPTEDLAPPAPPPPPGAAPPQ